MPLPRWLFRRRAPAVPIRRTRSRARRFGIEELEPRWTPAVDVTSFHFDDLGTGANLAETRLTLENVQPATFGKLFSTAVDGQVYGQPLYVSGVNVTAGPEPGIHNVLYVVTQHDSLYAIDADDGAVLWSRSYIDPAHNITTIPAPNYINSADIAPEVGITGTPVIDAATRTIYFVTKTMELRGVDRHFVQKLYAVDIASGATKPGGPAILGETIQLQSSYDYVAGAWVNGTGDGSVNGRIYYNALRQHQRAALSLHNGVVYVSSASHGDSGPYHGWILGYDAQSLNLVSAFNTTPNGTGGGIWMSAGEITFDSDGYFYVTVGNGTFTGNVDASGFPVDGNYGNAVLKLALDPQTHVDNQNINGYGLAVVDYFVPYNYAHLNNLDLDFGSCDLLLLPDSVGSAAHPHLAITAGKEGRLYLLDRDNLGKFHAAGDQVVQSALGVVNGSFLAPAYWNGSVYWVGNGDRAKQITISNGQVHIPPASASSQTFSFPGSSPTISADGTSNAIVWTIDRGTNQLRAYDANSLANLLYTSDMAGTRDQLGTAIKFATPIVTGGKVYVGTSGTIAAYGLLTPAGNIPRAPAGLSAQAVSATQVFLSWIDLSEDESSFVIEQSTDGRSFTTLLLVPAGQTAATVGGLAPNTTYCFRVRARNTAGDSAASSPAVAVTAPASVAGGLDFSSGFTGASAVLVLNGLEGGPPSINKTGQLLLTQSAMAQATSVFAASPVDITRFKSEFLFTITPGTSPPGDGFTFTIQRAGSHALGAMGSGLGYGSGTYDSGEGGIGTSAAIKFDFYNNQGEGDNSTGLAIGGFGPTSNGTVDLNPAGLILASGHAMLASLSYDGIDLCVCLTDTVTGVSAIQRYTQVDLVSLVGGTTAYVGFTAGTGGATATQMVSRWTYTPAAGPVPQAPTGLVASAITGQSIQLTWDAGTAGTLSLERRGPSDADFVPIALLPATTASYLDAGLVTDVVYSYRLRSWNFAGSSAASNTASAQTLLPPLTPSGATILDITDISVAMSWQDNATNEAGYRIYRKVGTEGAFDLLVTLPANTTSYLDNTVSPNTHYDYHIQAYNGAGWSDFTGLTLSTAPPAPTGLVSTAGASAIILNWNAAVGATGYNVYRGTYPGGEGPNPIALNVTTPQYFDSSVQAGVTYYYRVASVSAAAESSLSAEVSAATATRPAAPSNVHVTANSPGLVSLAWQDNANNELYYLVIRQNSVSGSMSLVGLLNPNTTSYSDTGFTQGQGYVYWVLSFNWAGISFPSGLAVTTVPAAPANLGAAVLNAGRIDLSWLPAAGGASYNVYRGTTPGGQGTTPIATGVSLTSFSDSGVVGGQTYYYRVSAVNVSGEGARSNEAIATAILGPPAAPSLLSATSIAADQVTLSWQDNSTNEQGWYLLRRTGTTGSFTTIAAIPAGTTTYANTGLSAGTIYQYAVVAYNVAGTSSAAQTQVLTTPAAPASLTATAGNGQVALNWAASASATSYTIYRGLTAGGEGTTPYATGIVGTSFVDSNVASGASYFYQVAAVNGSGAGPRSAEASATTPPFLPAPTNFAPTSVGTNQVLLGWTDNAPDEVGYYIYRAIGMGNFTLVATLSPNSTIFFDTGLSRGTLYRYAAIAYNASGYSDAAITFVTTNP